MARAWEEQQKDPTDGANCTFDERFGLLVDAEWLHRENARFARYVKEARLRLSQACVEDIDYPARRELDRAQIRQLATCRWVHEHREPFSPRRACGAPSVSVQLRPLISPDTPSA